MSTKHSFRKVTRQYARSIEALGKLLPPMMSGLSDTVSKQIEERSNLLDKHGTEIESKSGDVTIYHIDPGYEDRLRKLDWIIEDFATTVDLLPTTFLVTAVSQYDAYLGSLIREIVTVCPGILGTTDRKFTYKEVSEYDTLSEFKDHYVDMLIESVLRQSHSEQLKWLESKLGIPLTKDLVVWPKFIELTQRRNLFVHSAGRVSAQYLEVCSCHGVQHEGEVRRGTRLTVPPTYFLECIHVMQEIGIKLGQVVWRKLLPDEENAADSAAIDITYDLICRKEYPLATTLLEFLLHAIPRNNSETEQYMTMKLNLAQCYKWTEREAECNKILSEFNTKLLNDKYALVVHVLREEYKQAAECVRAIGANAEKMPQASYRVWPIFQKFRETEEFKSAYEEVYGENYIGNLVEEKSDSLLGDGNETGSNGAENGADLE